MKPPYEITAKILQLTTSISEKLGAIQAKFLDKPKTTLRKQNRIKTIHSSLKIEGNTLSIAQITALLENKRVIGPKKDVQEVLNAIAVYERLGDYKPASEKSFLKAHKLLMDNLITDSGKYRKQSVGIVKGNQVAHVAPPFENVRFLMKDLFTYLKNTNDIPLIKSCVFHYEMEFIHPFMDGNGRMGRLWQTLILMNEYPVFQFLPFETLISAHQEAYYEALAKSDALGESTPFIVYMLQIIDRSLKELLNHNHKNLSQSDRLDYFLSLVKNGFSRKEYMAVFSDISTATASRDLKEGVRLKRLRKIGDGNKSTYQAITTTKNGRP